MKSRRFIYILAAAAGILLLPFVAMQFTGEVKWSGFDFAVAGVLLLGSGLLCELVLRKVRRAKHRIILVAAVLAILVLLWAEMAVGIFGTPLAGS